MCGIVGFLGKRKSVFEVVETLEKLEYRGYDSAGVSFLKNQEIITIKSVGNINQLKNKIIKSLDSTSIIAHTRWATHGLVCEENAHPHVSTGGVWSVVHNGIIENYEELKQTLITKPKSQTDTSVLPQMLEEYESSDIQQFIEVFKNVKGSYAVVAQCKLQPNALFIAKHKSPLFVAQNGGDTLIASDPICFAGFSKQYYQLLDHEFAKITPEKIEFYDRHKNHISKVLNIIDSNFEDVSKLQYEHFMLKEIEEEPVAIKRQVDFFKTNNILSGFDKVFINQFNKIVFIGCGTAYHAGLMGAKFISKLTGIYSVAEIASELLYDKPQFIDSKTLCVFVSQSGETADTCGALALAKSKHATCVALTNVTYSTLANMADMILPVCAGPEIAVASTKAYVCQLTAIYMLACHIKNALENFEINYFEIMQNLAENILNFDMQKIDQLAQKIILKNDVIFIGKSLDNITATESALKLKEVTYINSTSYPSGELKHGFLALVEKGTFVFAIAGDKVSKIKTLNSASEAQSRGAVIVLVTNDDTYGADDVILIDETDEMLFAIRSIVPMQYLAYKTSVLKNINPDQPRNLAKSVTVE